VCPCSWPARLANYQADSAIERRALALLWHRRRLLAKPASLDSWQTWSSCVEHVFADFSYCNTSSSLFLVLVDRPVSSHVSIYAWIMPSGSSFCSRPRQCRLGASSQLDHLIFARHYEVLLTTCAAQRNRFLFRFISLDRSSNELLSLPESACYNRIADANRLHQPHR